MPRNVLLYLVALAVVALGWPSQVIASCPVPHVITNGQVADATQVMGNFNSIANCSVATTGSPAAGNLPVFSGTGSITAGNLSGDVATSGSLATSLSTTGVTPGSYTNPSFTVDAKGRITAASSGGAGDSGRLIGVQVISTPGAGTYAPTAGTNSIIVELVGAGGSGGGAVASSGNVSFGGGGGGGGYVRKRLTASFSGASYSVGTGGASPTAGNNVGNAGGNTTFTDTAGSPITYTAGGGAGGPGGVSSSGAASHGNAAGGAATNGDLNIPGSAGLGGWRFNGTNGESGAGGNSLLGHGGPRKPIWGGNGSIAGDPGTGYGGGGGSAITQGSGAAQTGGAGANGVIIIYEFS